MTALSTKRGVNKTEAATKQRLAALRAAPSNNDPEKLNPDRPLTEKQRAFVKFWAGGESIRSASLKAGYNDDASIAYRLAKDPAVLKIYNREKALYEESAQMSRKKVLEGLLEGVEMAKMQGDAGNVIGGWREVGKMCGYYEPIRRKIDINLSGSVEIRQLERMSDDQLLRLVKGEIEDAEFREIED